MVLLLRHLVEKALFAQPLDIPACVEKDRQSTKTLTMVVLLRVATVIHVISFKESLREGIAEKTNSTSY